MSKAEPHEQLPASGQLSRQYMTDSDYLANGGIGFSDAFNKQMGPEATKAPFGKIIASVPQRKALIQAQSATGVFSNRFDQLTNIFGQAHPETLAQHAYARESLVMQPTGHLPLPQPFDSDAALTPRPHTYGVPTYPTHLNTAIEQFGRRNILPTTYQSNQSDHQPTLSGQSTPHHPPAPPSSAVPRQMAKPTVFHGNAPSTSSNLIANRKRSASPDYVESDTETVQEGPQSSKAVPLVRQKGMTVPKTQR